MKNIIIAVLVVLLGVGGLYIYKLQKLDKQFADSNISTQDNGINNQDDKLDKPDTTNPATTTQPTPVPSPEWKIYTSSKDKFQIAYSSDFAIKENADLPELDFVTTGSAGVSFTYPSSYTNGTNLAEARVGVSRIPFVSDASCYTPAGTAGGAPSKTSLNGMDFYRTNVVEGAAGTTYETQIWATKSGTSCYRVSLLMRSGNLLNYDESIRPREFDKVAVIQVFERMLSGFGIIRTATIINNL